MKLFTEPQNIEQREIIRGPGNQQSPIDLLDYSPDRIKALPKQPITPTAPSVLTHRTFSGQVSWSSVGAARIFIPHGPLTGIFALRSLWFHQWSAAANTFTFALAICDVPATTFAGFDAGRRFFPNTILPDMINAITIVADTIHLTSLFHTLRLTSQYLVLDLLTNTPIINTPWTNYSIALEEI